MKTVISTLIVTAVFSALLGLMVMFSGWFNVSTVWKDPALVQWVLATTSANSVASRAKNIEVPSLGSEEQIKKGFQSFRAMCAGCHTPPGDDPTPMAQGLNPEAPDLAKSLKSPAEFFWVLKNGIRMTGMPGWGESHTDEQLWEMVSFIGELPEMTFLDYLFLNSEVPLDEDDGHGHTH
ncbi:MAG: cytochrome c [Nitrospirota bacterium]|nr:cytochrome c [Nitrospirota bacterium]